MPRQHTAALERHPPTGGKPPASVRASDNPPATHGMTNFPGAVFASRLSANPRALVKLPPHSAYRVSAASGWPLSAYFGCGCGGKRHVPQVLRISAPIRDITLVLCSGQAREVSDARPSEPASPHKRWPGQGVAEPHPRSALPISFVVLLPAGSCES